MNVARLGASLHACVRRGHYDTVLSPGAEIVDITTIRTRDAFVALRDEYVALRGRARLRHPESTPLSAHRWLAEWWRAFAAEAEVRAFCARERGELVALLPVLFSPRTMGGVPVVQASFLGSHWGGFDLPPRADVDWADALLAWLFSAEMPRWHVARLGPLLSAAVDETKLEAAVAQRGLRFRSSATTRPYLPLAKSWDAFLATRSRNFRRTIKRKQQTLDSDGGFELAHVESPTPADLHESVTLLSGTSWQGAAQVAVAATPAGRSFYDAIACRDAELVSHLFVLRHRDRCISYVLGVVCDGAFHAIDTAYDPAYAEYSPGLVVHFEALRRMSDAGAVSFEFGNDSEYKQRFDPEYRPCRDLLIFSNVAVYGFDRLVDTVKRVRSRYAPPRPGAALAVEVG